MPKSVQRMCIACRRMVDRQELIRLVVEEGSGLKLDEAKRRQGRGYYFCTDPACLERLEKPKERKRILVSLPSDKARLELIERLSQAIAERFPGEVAGAKREPRIFQAKVTPSVRADKES